MKRSTIVGLRILCLAGLLVSASFVYKFFLSSGKPPTVFDTVYAQCIVTLVTLLYYCVAKICMIICFPPKHATRAASLVPRDADGNYVDMQLTTSTQIVRGAPRLNLLNVWVFVYGVGFVLFIAGYCVLNLHALCLTSFGFGIGVLGLDELVCPRHTLSKLYTSVRMGSLLTCLVSVGLVSMELFWMKMVEFTSTVDLYSFVYGIGLPLISHFLMIAVRDSGRFTGGLVFEMCEFGLPFAAFLSVFHLTVAYGQRFQLENTLISGTNLFFNQTWTNAAFSSHVRTDGPFVLYYALMPLVVGPSVLGYVSCVLEGSSIDAILAVSLALCVHSIHENSVSAVGIYGIVCCCVSIGVRVIGECTFKLLPHPLNEHGQLDERVIWERETQRAAVAEELTRELEGDEASV